jgi:hypothetical protein
MSSPNETAVAPHGVTTAAGTTRPYFAQLIVTPHQ